MLSRTEIAGRKCASMALGASLRMRMHRLDFPREPAAVGCFHGAGDGRILRCGEDGTLVYPCLGRQSKHERPVPPRQAPAAWDGDQALAAAGDGRDGPGK